MKYSKSIIAISLISILSACGGSDNTTTPEPTMGTFNLGVSDNPADAEIVNIAFKQVVLKGNGESLSFDVSDSGELKHVDLLQFQGQEVETLVSGQSIPTGEYQMCIYMEKSEVANEESSYVKTADGIAGLTTNSNGSCGGVGAEDPNTGRLFFNKTFTIAAGSNVFVAEFNLAKGLQAPHGNKDYWTLKPTSVQLVNNAEVGAIEGQINASDSDTLDNVKADCEVAAGGTEFAQAVYLYPADTTLTNMVDFRPDADITTPQVAPIASARVNAMLDQNDEVTGYEYEFGFVTAGSYSLGYTCVAQNDDPETANNPDDAEMPFFIHIDEQTVEVTNGTTTERHFPMAFVPVS
ncbi:DUF4382 domain-containing protein [Shewanella colwelliana]|nr:DUF4382 domain-containing protein [Shewanella colwelliana]MDX1282618.1 DUF4382 domain-containing protein [Shewanella colwelliana]